MSKARALASLQHLAQVNLHPRAFVAAALELLHDVVPSTRNLFDWTDSQGQLTQYYVEGPIEARIAKLYFDEFHNKREAEAMPAFDSLLKHPQGVRSAQALDHPAFFKSALYNEIWRPQGFHWRLEGVVRSSAGTLLGSLVLYRGANQKPFSLADEQQLTAVLTPFARGLEATGDTDGVLLDETGAVAASTPAPFKPSAEAAETLLLTQQGQVCHATPGAHRLLLLARGDTGRASVSRSLNGFDDPLLQDLMARLRAQLGSCGVRPSGQGFESSAWLGGSSGVSMTRDVHGSRYLATAQLLQAHQAGAPWLVQVTLQRLEPQCVAQERALRKLPLTPAQLAVCRALVDGASYPQISQRLGVAHSTVVDHVRKAYCALGVASSAELRALVQMQ